jgi:hypothetical protein
MNDNTLTTEQRILIAMRQVLSSVVRDTTPPPGLRHPLNESTIEDIKQCFALITARGKDLNEEQGRPAARQRNTDEPRKSSQVVRLVNTEKKDS